MTHETETGASGGRRRRFLATYLAGALALSLAGCASTHRQEGSGEYFDDSVITAKVKAAVLNDPALKSSEINVETFKGAVQISGFVESRSDIDKAAALARSVKGVTAVKNSMQVKGAQ